MNIVQYWCTSKDHDEVADFDDASRNSYFVPRRGAYRLGFGSGALVDLEHSEFL